MGTGHRLAWPRSFLEVLPVSAGAAPEIVVVEGPSTREFLVSLVALPNDALVRVDYAPFAGTAVPEAATVAETVRGEAQRAARRPRLRAGAPGCADRAARGDRCRMLGGVAGGAAGTLRA